MVEIQTDDINITPITPSSALIPNGQDENITNIENITNNVVQIINDLASGLASGTIAASGPLSPAQEIRVALAVEAEKAINLIGSFAGHTGTTISATDFDALLTTRIAEYIAKITINPNRPNETIHTKLSEDLTQGTWYKEIILGWVNTTFIKGEGLEQGVDSLKELIALLENGEAGSVIGRILTLETDSKLLKDQVYGAQNSQDEPIAGTLHFRTGALEERARVLEDTTIPAERAARIAEDKRINEDVIGLAYDVSKDGQTVKGTIQKLRDEFTAEQTWRESKDDAHDIAVNNINTAFNALNADFQKVGNKDAYSRAITKVTQINIKNIFKR